MISIIVSSYQSRLLEKLKNNLNQTIDVDYEIIVVENNGIFGICEAYNKGATKSKFSYLCFMHEDILIKTVGWVQILIKQFERDVYTGLIGVAGTTYKSLAPGGWSNEQIETNRMHFLQYQNAVEEPKYYDSIQEDFEQVICVDGLFLFTKRSIWLENKFDENTFKDFHCYDLDFSLNINRNYKVIVTNQILLAHYSTGFLNEKWVDETMKLSEKWSKVLPLSTVVINRKLQNHIEWKQKIWFMTQLIRYKKYKKMLYVYFGFGFFRFFSFMYNLKAIKAVFNEHLNP